MLLSAVINLQFDTRPESRVVSEWVIHKLLEGKVPVGGEFCPYTISGILYAPKIGHYLRITTLTTPVSEIMLASLKHLPDEISLDTPSFKIQGFTTNTEAHPAAGSTTYPRLVLAAHKRHNPHRTLHWTTRFLTPTCLKDHFGLPSLLPEPMALYLDLQNRWQYFTETQLLPLDDFLSRCIEISHANLHTISATNPDSASRSAGFVGVVRYRLKSIESVERSFHKDWQHYLHMLQMLTQFGFYAGVGQGVELGMGQFRSRYQR